MAGDMGQQALTRPENLARNVRAADRLEMMTVVTQVFVSVRTLFRWWLSELAGFIPDRLKRISDNADRLVIESAGPDAVLLLESRNTVSTVGRIPLAEQVDSRQQLQSILRQRGLLRALSRGRLTVCLRIPANHSLRTTLDLPAAAEDNLHEVVEFELDRHTPFQADQVHFSSRVLKRDALAQRVAVDLTIVPRAVVAEALEVAARLGLDPDRIDVEGDVPSAAPSEIVLAHNGAQAARPASGRLTYGLAAVAVVLAVVAVMVPVNSMQRHAEALAREFAEIKRTTETIASLQKEIGALREEEAFLVDRKHKMPTVSRLLSDTTRILPDDTWLSEFQLAGADMQIVGFTASASTLIGLLEQSNTFRNTTFRSPVTRDNKADRERFHITARVVQEAEQ
jgi:general secretion pathway protein L